jgi:hypothetical protein
VTPAPLIEGQSELNGLIRIEGVDASRSPVVLPVQEAQPARKLLQRVAHARKNDVTVNGFFDKIQTPVDFRAIDGGDERIGGEAGIGPDAQKKLAEIHQA